MTINETAPVAKLPTPTNEEQLWGLWRNLLAAFVAYLRDTPPEKQRSAALATIAHFLKDNGIRVDGRATDELMKEAESLQALSLPFPTKH